MTQIMYSYPAMIAQAAEMNTFAATLQAVGADIASEQASLAAAWQGDTGTSYQVWQARWNQSMEELVQAYRAMANSYEQNTLAMSARDVAEGAKWV